MSSILRPLLIGGSLIAFATAAAAQDANAPPAYGVISLAQGFSPDPRDVAVNAGGGGISAPCGGFVRDGADVRLEYAGGPSTLIVSVASAVDTTLLIQGPDGAWYCDDDSGQGAGNPALAYERAGSGTYSIWVGGGGAAAPAELTLSQTISR